MLRKILYVLIALAVAGVITVTTTYQSFKSESLERLTTGGQIAETAVGPVEYAIYGEDGPYALFVHGSPGGFDQGSGIDGLRVIAPSRPGYLRTPLSVGKTSAEQADAFAALLDTLGIDEVFVMGASGGGPSALEFAARYPARTKALVQLEAVTQAIPLEDNVPFFLANDFMFWLMMNILDTLQGEAGVVSVLSQIPENQQRILDNAEQRKRAYEMVWSMWPVSHRLAGLGNDNTEFAQLNLSAAQVEVPTLIVHGTEDTNVAYEHATSLAERIPHAVLYTIEGADHAMPFSHAEEMNAAVESFLDEIEG